MLILIFSDKRDTYYYGQIDAIRGIIKWKLERNKDGEEVWTEIRKEVQLWLVNDCLNNVHKYLK